MEINSFAQGYLTCALWASNDDDGEPLDSKYDIEDIDSASLAKELKTCAKFEALFSNALQVFYERYDESQAGHDFFLTSRRHGAGFWDRDYGLDESMKKACEKLTEASKVIGGEESPYVGDDGKVYFY